MLWRENLLKLIEMGRTAKQQNQTIFFDTDTPDHKSDAVFDRGAGVWAGGKKIQQAPKGKR